MACPSDESLIRFVCGEVPTNDMAGIEKHIEGCEKCRKELTFIRGLEANLPELVGAEISPILSPEECPGAPSLAGYLDDAGSAEERSRIEAHLARCRSCLHEVIAAADRLAGAPREYRKAPVGLLDQAIRLGGPATRAEVLVSDGLWSKILRWFEPTLAHSRWLAGAGACAVAALAIFTVSQLYQREVVVTPGAGPSLNKLAERDGGAPRAPEDVVAESRIELSGDLKQALIDHDPKRGAESGSDLFEIIEKKAPQMPVRKIKNVEIKQNLLIAIASVSDLAGQVKLQLYKDGLLVISADS
jgi:anti-sigma factor RsiW